MSLLRLLTMSMTNDSSCRWSLRSSSVASGPEGVHLPPHHRSSYRLTEFPDLTEVQSVRRRSYWFWPTFSQCQQHVAISWIAHKLRWNPLSVVESTQTAAHAAMKDNEQASTMSGAKRVLASSRDRLLSASLFHLTLMLCQLRSQDGYGVSRASVFHGSENSMYISVAHGRVTH